MFKSIGNIASLMKTAQQMGGKMQEMNERLKTLRATGAAGGGMVEVDVNGLGEVLRAKIDPALFESGDREMIEDLLPAAFNHAQAKAKQLHQEAMKSMTNDLNLPGLSEALSQFSNTIGNDTIGNDTIGNDTIANDTIASDTIASDTIASDTIASDSVANEDVDPRTVS